MILTKLLTTNKTATRSYRLSYLASGFTIVEVLVVITVSALLASPVIFSLGGFYDDNLTSVTLSAQDTEVKNALATISNDLKETTGFRTSLTIPTATPQPPLGSSSNATAGGNWSYCGTTTTSTTCDGVTTNSNYSSKRALIAYVDATDGPTTSTTYSPVFLNNGAFNLSTATRATNAYIYFVAPDRSNSSINNLYRRTIVNVDPTNNTDWSNALYDCSVPIGQNPSSTNCVTPTPSLDTKNSCASTVVSSNTSFCASSDAVLLKDVESFWVDYYDSDNIKLESSYSEDSVIAFNAVNDIKNSARSVQLTVSKKLSGSPSKRSESSSRISINSNSLVVAAPPTTAAPEPSCIAPNSSSFTPNTLYAPTRANLRYSDLSLTNFTSILASTLWTTNAWAVGDAGGNVYVANYNYASEVLARVSSTGSILDMSGSMTSLGGIAIGPSSTLYVVDKTANDVIKITVVGGLCVKTPMGFTGLTGTYLAGVAVDSSGSVYVAQYSGTTPQVKKMTTTGAQSTVTTTGITAPYGLAVDNSDNLYISEYTYPNARVLKRTPTGVITDVGFATGLSNLMGVVVNKSNGTVYVLSDNYIVYSKTTGGTITSLALPSDGGNSGRIGGITLGVR